MSTFGRVVGFVTDKSLGIASAVYMTILGPPIRIFLSLKELKTRTPSTGNQKHDLSKY